MRFNVAIVSVKGNDYKIHFWCMSKDEAINLSTGLDITAGHRTMSLQKQILTGQKQSLLIILSDAFSC